MNKFPIFKFKTGNNKKYKIEAIENSIVYTKKAKKHLLELYYLIAQKNYQEKENI